MIERQNRDKIINTIFPERRVDDLKAYVSLNMHQIASPRYNRDALGLPPLTQEDTDECLDNSRIV